MGRQISSGEGPLTFPSIVRGSAPIPQVADIIPAETAVLAVLRDASSCYRPSDAETEAVFSVGESAGSNTLSRQAEHLVATLVINCVDDPELRDAIVSFGETGKIRTQQTRIADQRSRASSRLKTQLKQNLEAHALTTARYGRALLGVIILAESFYADYPSDLLSSAKHIGQMTRSLRKQNHPALAALDALQDRMFDGQEADDPQIVEQRKQVFYQSSRLLAYLVHRAMETIE